MMYILMKANTSRLQKSYSIQPLRSPIRNKAPRLENLLQKSPISRKIGKFNKSSISKKKSSIKKPLIDDFFTNCGGFVSCVRKMMMILLKEEEHKEGGLATSHLDQEDPQYFLQKLNSLIGQM